MLKRIRIILSLRAKRSNLTSLRSEDSYKTHETQQRLLHLHHDHKTNTVLYTGVTNNLLRRVSEHKAGKGGKFTSKYKITKLVYYECGSDINDAIDREKQIKDGSRQNKIDLINDINPEWEDLFDDL